MRSFLEIARNALRDVQHAGGPDEAYRERFNEAMWQIEHVCPVGALQWARRALPALTDKIDAEIIPRLDDLWNSHAPLAEFKTALAELVLMHTEVGKLYIARMNDGERENGP